jgi:hypothetical protein
MTDPELPAGYAPPPGTPLVTQADRWRRQRETLRVLADILDAHPDLPSICWTLGSNGGVIGDVVGLGMPPEEARATFTAWQQALTLQEVKEAPIRETGIVSLVGKTYCGIVRIELTTRLYYPVPDGTEPAEEPARGDGPRPGSRAALAPVRRGSSAGQHGTTPATRPGGLRAGPLAPPPMPEGPQPRHIP